MSPRFPSQVGCPPASLPAVLWAEPFPSPWPPREKRADPRASALHTGQPIGQMAGAPVSTMDAQGPPAPPWSWGGMGRKQPPSTEAGGKPLTTATRPPRLRPPLCAPPEDERCGWHLGLVLPCKPGAGARAEVSGPVGCGISGASCFLLQEALVQTEGPWTPSQDCGSREGRICLAGRAEGWPGCSLAAVWTSSWWRPCGQFPWSSCLGPGIST